MHDTGGLVWQRGNRCDSNQCVEIAFAGEHVMIRNSTVPDVRLSLSHSEWSAFVSWASATTGADGTLAA